MFGSWWSRWRPARPGANPAETASAGQTDLFISYSRTDIAFCRELADTIRGAGRSLWIDEEGIAPTEEWLAAIFKAIEACRCFVFVVSPASLQSRFCRMELEHAVQHNKKLIPVLWQPVEKAALPEAFEQFQWLDTSKYSDVAAVGAALLESADRDGPWITFHTRLLVRALDWDRANRARARLLTAGETRDARASLKQGAGKKPAPTALQEIFVATSRRHTIRIWTATSVLLGIGIAGTVAGIILYRGAEAARASDAQFRTADWAFSDGELPRAATHLMRAVSINPSNRDAQSRLYDLLIAQPVLVTRLGTTDNPLRAMAFDGKHNQLIAVDHDGRGLRLAAGAKDFEPLEAKDSPIPVSERSAIERHLMRWRLAADGQPMPAASVPLLALDPDTGRAAVRGGRGVVLIATDGSGKPRFTFFKSVVHSVHFLKVPNLVGVRLATELWLWHVDTGATCLVAELEKEKPVLMSRSGRWISVRSERGGLEESAYEELVGGQLELHCSDKEKRSPASPTVLEKFENARIMGLDLAPDGDVVAVTATSQEVVTLRFEGPNAAAPIKRRLRGVTGVFLRPDGQIAYVADRDGGLAAWSTLTGQPEFTTLRHATEPVAVQHNTTGDRLFVLTADGLVSVWDISGKSSALLRFQDASGSAAAPSDEPGRITATGRALSGTSGVWKLSSSGANVPEASFSHPLEGDDEKDTDAVWERYGIFPGTSAAVSRNGWTLVTIAGRSAPRVWDVGTGAEKARLKEAPARGRFSHAVWLSDMGDRALIRYSNATDDGARVSFAVFNTSSSARTLAFAPKWLLPDQSLLDVSPDLTRLLVGTGARVEVVDTDTLLPIARTTSDDVVLYARFLDNGQRFLTVDRERRYRIWNAENGLASGALLRLAADPPRRSQGQPTERLEDYARVPAPRIVERDGFSGLWLPPDDKAAPAGRAAIVPLVQRFSSADVERLAALAEILLGMRTKPDRSIELFPVDEIGPMRQRWMDSQGSTTSPVMDLALQKLHQRDPIESK